MASYIGLSALDMVPVELSEANFRVIESVKARFIQTTLKVSASVAQPQDAEVEPVMLKEEILPERVVIEKISVDVPVLNPETRDVGELDRALLEGAVRYPGSGGLDDESNMFLFAHSTGYRTVRNQAFKSFNHLGDLKIGDVVSVYAQGVEYRYQVSSVAHVDSDDALVEFSVGKKTLTLSTCDSFGEKSDRFVVRADFVQRIGLQEQAI